MPEHINHTFIPYEESNFLKEPILNTEFLFSFLSELKNGKGDKVAFTY